MTTRLIQALMTWARTRRALVLALAGLLTLACLIPVSRLRFDADVLNLMPRDTGAVEAFDTYLARFGSLDALYVYVQAPEGTVAGDYEEFVDDLATALRALPEVVRVDAGPMDPTKDWSYITDRQLLLLDVPALDAAMRQLDPEHVRTSVRATRDLLTVPSVEIKALAQRDPLGWFELLRDRMRAMSGMLQLDRSNARGYVTPDGRAQLLLVRPAQPPFDTTFSRALLDGVSRAEATTRDAWRDRWAEDELPPPSVDVAGGHRTAIETESLVRSEAIGNAAASLVGVLALLYLAFRNVWLVLFGAVPVLLATLVTFAAHQLAGVQLAAAAAGASAMLFGLGDDGIVLLFVTYRERLSRGLTPLEAVRELGSTGASVFLGATTTAATFLGLYFISFPSLQQFGLFIGIGILLTVLFTFTVLVAGLPGTAWATRARDLRMPGLAEWISRHRRVILWSAAVVTLPLAWGLTMLHVDTRLERLRPRGAGYALEEAITSRFGLARDVYLVMDRGRDLDALLARNEKLTDTLEGTPDLSVSSASALLPSRDTQDARRAVLARTDADSAEVADIVDRVASEEGFVDGTFQPFRERAARVLDPTQSLTFEGFAAHGLDDVLGRFLRQDGDTYLGVTYAYAHTPAAVRALSNAVAAQPSAVLTGLPLVNQALSDRFPRELFLGLGTGTLIVVLLIWIEFRAWGPTALALIPTVFGIVWGLGALGWAGVTLDLFSVFAILMFLGIGVDYGIHLLHPLLPGHGSGVRDAVALVGPAMLLAGATTIVGFGTLIWSDYLPLHSLGLASVATVGASLLCALFVLPALLMHAWGDA